MNYKYLATACLLLFFILPILSQPIYADASDIVLKWNLESQLYQDVNTKITISITNNLPVSIYAQNILMHYSWMPQYSFVYASCYKIVQPNSTVLSDILVHVPKDAKLGKTTEFTCYLKYLVYNGTGFPDTGIQSQTNTVRAPQTTINSGKSIYIKPILYLDNITGICAIFLSIMALIYGFRKKLIFWLEDHKKRIPVIIFIIPFLVYVVCLSMNYTPYLSNVITQQGFAITGDEPHYILMTRALLSGKVDADSIYVNPGMFRHTRFSLGALNYGLEISSHSYGLPLISTIPYFLGLSLLGSGVAGVLIFICVLTALISVIIYKITMFVTNENLVVCLLTTMAFAFATFLFMWSGQFFTENVTGFFIILAIYKLLTAKTKFDWAIGGAILGILPFIKYQSIFLSVGCLLILCLLFIRGIKSVKSTIITLSILIFVYIMYMYLFIGLINVTMLGSDYLRPESVVNIFGYSFNKTFYLGIFGLLLDRNCGLLLYSPIIILSGLGFFQLLKLKNSAIYLGIFLSVFWFGSISVYTAWNGWISIPGKYMVMIQPFFSIPFALGMVDFIKNKLYIPSYFILFLIGLIPNAIIASNRVFGYTMFASMAGDFNWYTSNLNDLGFHGEWTPDFTNIMASGGKNVQTIILYIVAMFVILSILLFYSYKKANSQKIEP